MAKNRAFMHLGVALLLSLFVGIVALKWLAGEQARAKAEAVAPAVRSVDIVVASVPVVRGTKLESAMLKTLPYFEQSLPAGNFTDPSKVEGRFLNQPVNPGDPITAEKLVPEGATTGGMSVIINPGKRAISVKGNKVLGLGGFIGPGNMVDVLVTIKDEESQPQRTWTKVVLENVLVMATGNELDKKPGKEEVSSMDIYTLEVTPEEAEKLSLAATQGTLHFALRNPMDKDTVLTPGAHAGTTLSSFRTAEVPARPKAAPAPSAPALPKAAVVEVIKGDKIDKISF